VASIPLFAPETSIGSLVTACAETCDGGAAPDCEIMRAG
jgi:hypothetical protein